MSNEKKQPQSYEEAMKELQQIIQVLQSEAMNIDELSVKVKRSAALITFCKEKLRATESELNDLF